MNYLFHCMLSLVNIFADLQCECNVFDLQKKMLCIISKGSTRGSITSSGMQDLLESAAVSE